MQDSVHQQQQEDVWLTIVPCLVILNGGWTVVYRTLRANVFRGIATAMGAEIHEQISVCRMVQP